MKATAEGWRAKEVNIKDAIAKEAAKLKTARVKSVLETAAEVNCHVKPTTRSWLSGLRQRLC